MPEGGDLSLYDARRDWSSEDGARHAFYDLLRDSGHGHDQAVRVAADAAQKFARDHGEAPPREEIRPGSAPTADRRSGHAERKVPYWGPHAGKLCRVLPDGTLEPM